MKKFYTCIIILFLATLLCSCKPNNSQQTTYTVASQNISHALTYKGIIEPLQTINIQSPADGTVQKVLFTPGSLVKKDQLLLTLYSPKYVTDYQTAMLTYLKAKSDYTNAQTSFLGTEELWKNGLISHDEYNTQKTTLENSYAMLLQQQDAIKKYLPPGANIDPALTLENKAALTKLFSNANNAVNVYAPTTGIALGATKTDQNRSGNDAASTLRLSPGNEARQGDSLLTIGDLTGFNLIVSVSEMDINKIKTNMKASVSSDAFPETLSGLVSEVGIQAKSNSSDATLPEFPVRVSVPNVPTADLENIRVGMTAKVDIELGGKQQLLIPLSAVGSENGRDVVKKINAAHKIEIVPVTTGETTLDQVTILSGLKHGDQILVPY